jgi:ABC-type Fe3+/spermidine/putrescine transport system ATPase subunit
MRFSAPDGSGQCRVRPQGARRRARRTPAPGGWALELARLADLGDRRPDQLSGGQRQRVALARCLVMQPAILLLDEPMAALDRGLRAQVQQELISIQRKVGTTFIVVTHDQEEAMAISDYIAVMDKGRIAQFDAPRTLYEKPRSRFVASFLGNINLFDGSAGVTCSRGRRFTTNDGLEMIIAPADCAIQRAYARWDSGRSGCSYRGSRSNCPNDWPGVIEQISYGGTLSRATIRLRRRPSAGRDADECPRRFRW